MELHDMKIACFIPEYNAPITDPCCYPLGYGYIIAVLKQAGHDVTVYNLNLYDPPNQNDLLLFDNVLMAGFEESRDQIIQLGTICNELGVRCILGHGMATYNTPEIAGLYDAIVVGEGESVILDALRIDGIHYGKPVPLDSMPLPDYEAIGINDYHKRHTLRYMGVLGSRGCPHACTFCSNICSFRCRSISAIEEEIDLYRNKYKIEHLVVYDNTLNVSNGRFRRFAQMMQGKGLTWSACLRADNLEESTIKMAKNNGFEYALLGIESLRQNKLDEFNKKLNVSDIYRAMDMFSRHRIKFVGGAFVGTGQDTFEDVIEDIDLMKKSGYNIAPNTLTEFAGIKAKKSGGISYQQHAALDQLCGDYRMQNGVTFGGGFKPASVVGCLC